MAVCCAYTPAWVSHEEMSWPISSLQVIQDKLMQSFLVYLWHYWHYIWRYDCAYTTAWVSPWWRAMTYLISPGDTRQVGQVFPCMFFILLSPQEFLSSNLRQVEEVFSPVSSLQVIPRQTHEAFLCMCYCLYNSLSIPWPISFPKWSTMCWSSLPPFVGSWYLQSQQGVQETLLKTTGCSLSLCVLDLPISTASLGDLA